MGYIILPVLWLFIGFSEAFLFTINKNNALGSCQPNFLCPPMCLKKTTSGCNCDCSSMDPSHPGNLGINPNQQINSAAQIMTSSAVTQSPTITTSFRSTAAQTSITSTVTSHATTTGKATTSHVSSHTSQTSSTRATTPSVNTSQKAITSPVFSTKSQPSSTKLTTPSMTPALSSSTISNTTISSSSVSSPSSTKSFNSCQGAIQCILSCKNGFVIDPTPGPDGCPSCSCKTVPTTLKTNMSSTSFKPVSFPAHITISPSVTTPTTTTRPPSSTLRRIVCPGVFNCSKTCYTGYRLDSQGCPLCECAPQPTGLP
ncbi:uncharacterized protein LOC133198436 [Saccostrea echinata]|uniref:uncharacterized protein LOC133198436 n=1 Tax=Saccostrea echinata TaxID=191078 RepID=UPI002A821734|nr:uncharacterized protein LOC133198436 [Saccostrea echinata]